MTVQLRIIRNDAGKPAWSQFAERSKAAIVDPLETIVAHSIEELDRREWDSLFQAELGDWDYLHALESAHLDGCDPVYFAIRSRGRLVAAVPGFVGRRALGEPWRARGRAQWRRAPARTLVLGSPLAAACRIGFAPGLSVVAQATLVDGVLRAARDESARRGLDGVLVSGDDAALADTYQRAESLRLARTRGAQAARMVLPPWSFSEYLSCFEDGLRGRLLRVCAQAAHYERDWHVDLDVDVEPMIALCREAGLDEINRAFFEALLGSRGVSASCLLLRANGDLAGFSLVLHDARALREKLTVVSRREKGALVRGVIWLETLRLCLERGIRTYESTSELSLSAARPDELIERSGWVGTHDAPSTAARS
jgi:hypothetical protein